MRMESLYDVLKVTSFVATGIFGALALLTKYKDDDNKMTRWGKIALAGILISSSISLGLYVIETSKAKAAAEKAKADAEATTTRLADIFTAAQTSVNQQSENLKKTDELKTGLETAIEQQNKNLQRSDDIAQGMELSLLGQKHVLGGNRKILGGVQDSITRQENLLVLNTGTLSEVRRGLIRIKDVTASFWIRIPTEHSQLKPFLERFEKELWQTEEVSQRGLKDIFFTEKSPLFPDWKREALAFHLLNSSGVDILFYKKSVAPRCLRTDNNKPDLTMHIYTAPNEQLTQGHKIFYNLDNKQFRIRGYRVASDPENWDNNQEIISLFDLVNTQMIVIPRAVVMTADPKLNDDLAEIKPNFDFKELILSFGDGRLFRFDREKGLTKCPEKTVLPMYSFDFPSSPEGLKRLGY